MQKNRFSGRKMHFPTEKCTFLLQKFALSCRNVHFPAEKRTFLQKNAVFRGAHGRKPQEIAGGLQGSRIKNASQLSQEMLSKAPTRNIPERVRDTIRTFPKIKSEAPPVGNPWFSFSHNRSRYSSWVDADLAWRSQHAPMPLCRSHVVKCGTARRGNGRRTR